MRMDSGGILACETVRAEQWERIARNALVALTNAKRHGVASC